MLHSRRVWCLSSGNEFLFGMCPCFHSTQIHVRPAGNVSTLTRQIIKIPHLEFSFSTISFCSFFTVHCQCGCFSCCYHIKMTIAICHVVFKELELSHSSVQWAFPCDCSLLCILSYSLNIFCQAPSTKDMNFTQCENMHQPRSLE